MMIKGRWARHIRWKSWRFGSASGEGGTIGAAAITTDWLRRYNTERPHDSLGRVPPLTFCRGQPAPQSPLLTCVRDGGAYRASWPSRY